MEEWQRPDHPLRDRGKSRRASTASSFGVNLVKAGDRRTVDNFRTDCLWELKKIKIQSTWQDLNDAMSQGVLILAGAGYYLAE